MLINITQAHINAGIKLSTADPFALAIKEACEAFYSDPEYKRTQLDPVNCSRVEVVASVTSSILVTNHFIIRRKGREEVELGHQKFHFGPDGLFDLRNPAFDWMVAYGNGQPVQPIVIEITMAEGWSSPVANTKLKYTPPKTWNEVPPWGVTRVELT